MQRGWISLHRQISDHWIWEDKPYSFGQAWIDMLLLANHEKSKFPFGSEVVTVERGSFITSELKLMERWGWSKTKVRRFLELLISDQMIEKKTDRRKTTIFIVNYNIFQDLKTTERPIKNQSETDSRPIKDINNNKNNLNNDNKQKKIICPEPENLTPDQPPVISLVLNDKTEFPITQDQIDKWSEFFPAVDVMQELRKMKSWLDANPTRRKTRRGIMRFVNNWLSKAQDQGGTKLKKTEDERRGEVFESESTIRLF